MRHRLPLLPTLLLAALVAATSACDLRADPAGGGNNAGGSGSGSGSGSDGNGTTTAPGGTSPSNPTNPNTASTPAGSPIRSIGRVFTNGSNNRLQLSWPGTALQFSTQSKSLKVTFNVVDDPQVGGNGAAIVTLVDGVVVGTKTVIGSGQSDVSVQGLDGSLHVVTLIKATEAQAGDLQYVGVTGGTLETSTQAAPGRLIEFVGDSISAGYGVDGPADNSNTCTTQARPLGGADPSLANAALAHPVLVARALKADWSVVAFSGKGIYRNFSKEDQVTMPALWLQASPDQNLTWPLATQPQPDAVVINLGTNDFNRKDALDDAAFTSTYASFLTLVRKTYPSAYILVVVPMLSDSVLMGDGQKQLTEASADITAAVKQSGITSKISIFKLQASDNLSCDGHPDVKGQALIATQIQGALQAMTGW